MSDFPIDAATASSFVKKLGERLDYNINIMDRGGVIIASRDQTRVGSYHEAARRLVESGRDAEEIGPEDELPAGVRPGVNLPLVNKGETIGVVGVTGDPAEVRAVAFAVKTSLESMVELALFKERMLRRQDKKNLLINFLIYEDEPSLAAGENLAAKLGYDPRIPRSPILFRLGEGIEPTEGLGAIKAHSLHGLGDISATLPDGSVLVFKSLKLERRETLAAFEAQVRDYVRASNQALRPLSTVIGAPARSYVGMFQFDFSQYRGAYRQALWLSERYPSAEESPLFLFRRMAEYLTSRVPRAELIDALGPVASLLPEEAALDFSQTIEALRDCFFNATEAAAALGIHRNSLSARLERLRAIFGLDPRGDARASELLGLVAKYLESR
ncbi:MAG: sugar diacid recognition domain-containing protein [Spirochaetaceae bacterium]|nr:sugar diacid recognition domain-containing protein [Spirochaetaceae bacterium]